MNKEAKLAQDLEFLQQAVEHQGHLPADVDAGLFVRCLVQNFASTNPVLRDNLSYRLVAKLILRGYLTLDEHKELLNLAVDDEHLFHGIGQTGTDSVFMRTFSVLLIPLLTKNPNQAPALDVEVMERVIDSVLRYAASERDWRGYVPEKGWAHAVAHTADALEACGIHPTTTETSANRILGAIKHLAMVPYPLGYLEDDRLAYAAFAIIQKGKISTAGVEQWLDSFQLADDQDNDGDETLCGSNAEHFLRSLYFRFLTADRTSPWLPKIEAALSRFDIYQMS